MMWGEGGDGPGQLDPITGRWVPGGNGQRQRKSRTPVVLAVVAGLVVIGGAFASAELLSGTDTAAAGVGPVRTVQPTVSSTPSTTSTATGSSPATTKAATAGWQGVDGARYGIAYDVPKKWQVESAGQVIGFEKPDPKAPFGYSPLISGGAAATLQGTCNEKKGNWAEAAVFSVTDVPLEKAAAGGAVLWLKGATMDAKYKQQSIAVPAAKDLTLAGGLKAKTATQSAPVKDQTPKCPAPRMSVTSVAVPIGGKIRILVVQTSQGASGAVSQQVVDKIAKSLRAK